MTPDAWMDGKLREVIPRASEDQAVRLALDAVETALEDAGGPFRIAERHPCGSFAKATMLAGRKEADLVVVLREPPTESTLEDFRDLLARAASAGGAKVCYKAIAVEFADGVMVDVLPVAKPGITASAQSIPPKLLHALSGPKHVEWFTSVAHGTPVHPTVRLLKHFRATHPSWRRLSSFALEVLAVELLRGLDGGLSALFKHVLSRVADGYLEKRSLLDPADSANDLLSAVDDAERASIARAAREALRHVDSETWSSVFTGASAALPSSNIGGRTLA